MSVSAYAWMKCCQINDGWLTEERGWRERMEREDGERMDV
jgi:hypothetical protein